MLHEKLTFAAHWLACAGSVIYDDDGDDDDYTAPHRTAIHLVFSAIHFCTAVTPQTRPSADASIVQCATYMRRAFERRASETSSPAAAAATKTQQAGGVNTTPTGSDTAAVGGVGPGDLPLSNRPSVSGRNVLRRVAVLSNDNGVCLLVRGCWPYQHLLIVMLCNLATRRGRWAIDSAGRLAYVSVQATPYLPTTASLRSLHRTTHLTCQQCDAWSMVWYLEHHIHKMCTNQCVESIVTHNLNHCWCCKACRVSVHALSSLRHKRLSRLAGCCRRRLSR